MPKNYTEDSEIIKFGRMLSNLYVPKTYSLYEPNKNYPRDGWVKTDCETFQKYTFYKNSKSQSINDQPTTIETWHADNSCVFSVEWTEEGVLHRIGGPAKIYLDKDAKYCISGIEYTKQEYWNHPLVVQHILDRILEEKETSL